MTNWIWVSPNGVDHLVDDKGRCATCGRHHQYQIATNRPDILMAEAREQGEF